jgi:hypothetical protein
MRFVMAKQEPKFVVVVEGQSESGSMLYRTAPLPVADAVSFAARVRGQGRGSVMEATIHPALRAILDKFLEIPHTADVLAAILKRTVQPAWHYEREPALLEKAIK